MDNKLIKFGKRLAELRNSKNYTQEKLAELIGYSTNHISKLELARTNPSFDLIVKISNALDIEVKELFDFKNNQNTTKKLRIKIEKSIDNLNTKELKFINEIINNLSLLKQKPPLKQ